MPNTIPLTVGTGLAQAQEQRWAGTLLQQEPGLEGGIAWDVPPLGETPHLATYLQLLFCSGRLLADGVPHFRA